VNVAIFWDELRLVGEMSIELPNSWFSAKVVQAIRYKKKYIKGMALKKLGVFV